MTLDLTNQEVKEAVELATMAADIMEPDYIEWMLAEDADIDYYMEVGSYEN